MSNRTFRAVGLGLAAVLASSCARFSPYPTPPHPLEAKWEKERSWLHRNVQSVLFADHSGYIGSYKVTSGDLMNEVIDDFVEREAWLEWAPKNNIPIPGNAAETKYVQDGYLELRDESHGEILRGISYPRGSDLDLGSELLQDLESARRTGKLQPNPQPSSSSAAKLSG